MLEFHITQSLNSVEVAYDWAPENAGDGSDTVVRTSIPPAVEKASREDQIAGILAQGTVCFSTMRRAPEACAADDGLPPLRVSLCDPSSGDQASAPNSSWRGRRSAGPVKIPRETLLLSAHERLQAFHLLPPGRQFAVVLVPSAAGPTTALPEDDFREGSLVDVGQGFLGRIAGPRRKRSSGGAGLFSQLLPTSAGVGGEEVVPVEIVLGDRMRSQEMSISKLQHPPQAFSAELGGLPPLLVLNLQTPPGPRGLGGDITRRLLLPWQRLGPWLLDVPGNYAYTTSMDQRFWVEMLEHGLFILPGDQQIMSCPFPETPFLFKLQEDLGDGKAAGASWRKCKMLRRYSSEFDLTVNRDLVGHLRLCGEYHEERGGTWISERFIDTIVSIHNDPQNQVKVYAFELWDRATGQLAAASFGLAIGSFFHDFSMCCLVRDRRSAGAILSKAIGALLTDCGVKDWYWGCMAEYMKEYKAHGAQEVPRKEYYDRLRSAVKEPLRRDPAEAVRAGEALIRPPVVAAA